MPRTFLIRRATPREFDAVAAFCAGRGRDAAARGIRRRRRYWLEEMAAKGLAVLLAVEPAPPAVITFGGERLSRDELTTLGDGLVVGILEYLPVAATLYPVEGEEYLFVDCLRVMAPFLGRGVGAALLRSVIREARTRRTGVATIAWRGAEPFTDWSYMPAAFFRGFGFGVVDEDGERVLLAVDYGAREVPRFVRAAPRSAVGVEYLYHPSCPASAWGAAKVVEELEGRGGEEVRTVEVAGRRGAREYGALFGICRDGQLVVKRLAFYDDVVATLTTGK